MKTIVKIMRTTTLVVAATAALGAAVVYTGIYNVAADDPHTRPVYALLETARSRSIAVRAGRLQVPADLDDPARIRQGAGNYDAMCAGCHLAPGAAPTELSRGLYPAPPDLTRATVGAAEAFWAIKHGIKASGMPAWGKSMGDEYIWNMAAFVRELPKLDRDGYRALVAGSGGHDHGGGETGGHAHAEGADDAHDGMKEMPAVQTPDRADPHRHADGKAHAHPPAATIPGKAAAGDPPTTPAAPSPAADEPSEGGHVHEH